MQLLEQIAIGEEPVTEEDFVLHSVLLETHFFQKGFTESRYNQKDTRTKTCFCFCW